MPKLFSRAVLFSSTLFVALGLSSLRANAQSPALPGERLVPMTPIQGEQTPFTETVAAMAARDAQITQEIKDGKRPPRESIARFHDAAWIEAEERREEALGATIQRAPLRRTPPLKGTPYRGALDPTGHFIPAPTSPGESGPIRAMGPQGLSTGFAGPSLQTMVSSFGYYNIPPDTQGAIGPNHAMILCNGIVQIYSRTGGAALSSVTLDSFATVTIGGTTYPRTFDTVTNKTVVGGAFDPRVLYDRQTGRWFATIMESGADGQTNNGVILAVSRTSDPTGTWDKYFVNFGVAGAFTDYSTLGVDSNGVYMAATIFGASVTATIAATPKASLIFNATTNPTPSLGTVSMTTNIGGMFGTPHPAQNVDNSAAANRAWFIASSTSSAGGLRYRQVSWSGSTPSITGANVTLSIGGGIENPFPSFSPSGSVQPVDTGDYRLQQAVIRNNTLYASRTNWMNSAGATAFGAGVTEDRAGCEWFQLGVSTTTATAVQTGRVFDSSVTPRHYFYPSLAANGLGHVAMTMSGATTGEFIGTYTTGRLVSDAANTMQSILQTKAGQAAYTVTFTANNSGGDNRYGDYSFTMVDPNDDQSIWGFQEFAATPGASTNSAASGIAGNWQIWIQKLLSPALTASATQVTAIPGQTNVSLPITGTELFDPGTSFTNRLTATASGTGISNVRVAYINATKASVTFDVSGSATAGTRNITLTNPDGQSVTINNAINVAAGQPVLAFSRTITNTGSAWRVALTITNNGGSAATSVRVLTSLLGATATSTATPITVGTIAAGASAVVNINFPLAAATAGTPVIHRVTGDYAGNNFSSAARITP